jgi:uncharacterized protein YnzC (UPF0291/DUF896 family)
MSEAIITRINHLLNKTEANGCSVAEAAAAAKIAQQLLSQYRLTVADLSTNEDIHNESDPLFVGARRIHWKDKLANCLATVNGCKAYVDTVPTYRHGRANHGNQIYCRLIGRDSDIQIVRYFFTYLEREIEIMCKATMKRGYGSGKTWSNSFKNGAADAICDRLREANREVREVAQENNSMALVKLDLRDAEIDKWAQENKLRFKAPPAKMVFVDSSVYGQGTRAGKNINLNKGITGKGEKKTNQLN